MAEKGREPAELLFVLLIRHSSEAVTHLSCSAQPRECAKVHDTAIEVLHTGRAACKDTAKLVD